MDDYLDDLKEALGKLAQAQAEIERLKLEWTGMKSEVDVCHRQIGALRYKAERFHDANLLITKTLIEKEDEIAALRKQVAEARELIKQSIVVDSDYRQRRDEWLAANKGETLGYRRTLTEAELDMLEHGLNYSFDKPNPPNNAKK